MRRYDYKTKPKSLLTPEIVSMLTLIHERTLAKLVKEDFLAMIGAGPAAGYVKK
jgi:hypothetical protein